MTNHIVTSRAIVVTGASGGIGRVLVQKLAAKNFTVFAAARCVDQPTDRIKSQPAGGRIVLLPLDVTDEKSIAQFVEEISVYAGKSGIAGLVNNAGVMVQGPLELVAPNDFRLQFDVNVVGPFSLTRALLPLLRLGRGRVVNIGAVTAHTTVPFFGPISASKAALASLTDAMRMEFAPLGIKVILIEPGAIATGIHEKSRALQREALAQGSPSKVSFYAPALTAVAGVMKKSPVDQPDVVAKAIIAALTDLNPKPRQTVGKGASQLVVLRYLPIGLRDRLLTGSLGIAKALRTAAALQSNIESRTAVSL
jgi:NAD(P)-dependent dehydrogenase (short-subunit alcohol dehydrogenase family)